MGDEIARELGWVGVRRFAGLAGENRVMVWVDLDALRPVAAEVELVGGLLVEVGPATAGDLAADLALPLATVGGALRVLERAGRARRSGRVWLGATPAPRSPRRSWVQGGA